MSIFIFFFHCSIFLESSFSPLSSSSSPIFFIFLNQIIRNEGEAFNYFANEEYLSDARIVEAVDHLYDVYEKSFFSFISQFFRHDPNVSRHSFSIGVKVIPFFFSLHLSVCVYFF